MPSPELPLLVFWEKTLGEVLDRTQKFPKAARFTFSSRIDNLALDNLDGIVAARYAPSGQKATKLREIDISLSRLRVLLRVAHDRDGLTDLVRIRANGICYWPNLGHGKFGPKVVMLNAPVLASSDIFNPRYVKLADVDGSGTVDLFYFGSRRPKVWLNQCGNSYDDGHELPALPVDNMSSVELIDLLGKGTSCIVWSTFLPGYSAYQMRYIDLAEEGKPHLLTSIDNGMGKVLFDPSTQKLAHCVAR